MFKLNTRLLIQTLSQQSCKNHDEEMFNYIKNSLAQIKGVTTQVDDYGNILATKGKAELYPCVCSHYDTVHAIIPDKKIIQEQDLLYAFSYTKMSQIGIGGEVIAS